MKLKDCNSLYEVFTDESYSFKQCNIWKKITKTLHLKKSN